MSYPLSTCCDLYCWSNIKVTLCRENSNDAGGLLIWSVVWCVFIVLHFTSHFSKNNPPYCVTVTFIIVPLSSELFIHVQPLLHVSHNSDREILFPVLIPTCQLTIGEWLGGVGSPPVPLYHWRCVVSCNVLLLLLLHCSTHQLSR